MALVDPIVGAESGGDPNARNAIGRRQGLVGSSTAPGWTCCSGSGRISLALTQTFNGFKANCGCLCAPHRF
jgi:hypothetical protein